MAKSIRERAQGLCDWILRRDGLLKHAGLLSLIERELAEQDIISRSEQKEECIKVFCESCHQYEKSMLPGATCFRHSDCDHLENFKKELRSVV